VRIIIYAPPAAFLPASESERAGLCRLTEDACGHTSHGSYDMLARWVRASRCVTGRNRLDRRATTMDDGYPVMSGCHAELDLWHRCRPRGGTVFVAGVLAGSGSAMLTSQPCHFCAALLVASGVRRVVFWSGGDAVKAHPLTLTSSNA
jgi:tRNA(Arg) A34 adenosine deaminase TadA